MVGVSTKDVGSGIPVGAGAAQLLIRKNAISVQTAHREGRMLTSMKA
jgi:hypothetical protein